MKKLPADNNLDLAQFMNALFHFIIGGNSNAHT